MSGCQHLENNIRAIGQIIMAVPYEQQLIFCRFKQSSALCTKTLRQTNDGNASKTQYTDK
jgi:hypothetical protein